jgi:hypothetical protein
VKAVNRGRLKAGLGESWTQSRILIMSALGWSILVNYKNLIVLKQMCISWEMFKTVGF